MRETIARVLRSYGLSPRGQATNPRDVVDGEQSLLAFTDADFDPAAWDRDEWQAAAAAGLRRAVLRRVSAAHIPLSPHGDEPPALRIVVAAPADPELDHLRLLHEQGVRGVRFVLDNTIDPYAVLHYADQLVPLDWHVEFVLRGADAALPLAEVEWVLTRLPIVSCFSGLADFLEQRQADDAEVALLLEFVQMGRFWLKVSGSEVAAAPRARQQVMRELVNAAMAVREDRLVWGSGAMPSSSVDVRTHVGVAFETLQLWIPDDARRQAVLWSNPARLYRF